MWLKCVGFHTFISQNKSVVKSNVDFTQTNQSGIVVYTRFKVQLKWCTITMSVFQCLI